MSSTGARAPMMWWGTRQPSGIGPRRSGRPGLTSTPPWPLSPATSSAAAAVRDLGAGLQKLLEPAIAHRRGPPGLPAHERQERHADAVTDKVERERDPRAGAAVDGLDRDRCAGSDRSGVAAGGPPV